MADEQATGHETYEGVLAGLMRRELDLLPLPGVMLDSVHVEGTGPLAEVIFLFRHDRLPVKSAGYRFPARDDSVSSQDAESWAPVVRANLDEAVTEAIIAFERGHAFDPSPDGVFWLHTFQE
ncbi:hypothetical protein ACFFMN_19930 [Planobispora siamensis]|nr:hypothetical protein [Planobispora siamensis]